MTSRPNLEVGRFNLQSWRLDVLTVFSSVSRLTHIYVSAPHFLHKNGPQFISIKNGNIPVRWQEKRGWWSNDVKTTRQEILRSRQICFKNQLRIFSKSTKIKDTESKQMKSHFVYIITQLG
jgi:hypothetical protein